MAQLTHATAFSRKKDLPGSRRWYVVDAGGLILGRVASRIAYVLKGKHKPDYDPHHDNGDHVVVLNAAKIELTGRKLDQKESYYFTGYPTGHKRTQYKKLMVEDPEHAVYLAVKGMLPKNSMGKAMIKKMQVYRDDKHPHAAQNPSPLPAFVGPRPSKGPK